MFKFIFKSTLYYFLMKHYKSKILSIVFFTLLIIIITILYADVLEYMALNELKQEVFYLMLGKWFIYFISSYKIYSNIKLIVIGNKKSDETYQEQVNETKEYINDIVSKSVNSKYKHIDDVIAHKINLKYENIRNKKTLKTEEDAIYNEYK